MNSGIIIPCKRTGQGRQMSSDNDSASLYFGLISNPKYQNSQLPPQFGCNHCGRAHLIIMTIMAMTLGKSSTSWCTGTSRNKQKILHPAVGTQAELVTSHLLDFFYNQHKKFGWVLDLGISCFRSTCQGHTSSVGLCCCLVLGIQWYWRCFRVFHPNSSCCSKRI